MVKSFVPLAQWVDKQIPHPSNLLRPRLISGMESAPWDLTGLLWYFKLSVCPKPLSQGLTQLPGTNFYSTESKTENAGKTLENGVSSAQNNKKVIVYKGVF